MLRRHLMAAALAALLSACSDGGGADEDTRYLPLATGNRWVFDDGEDSVVSGLRDVGGQRWWVVADRLDPTNEGLLREDTQGIVVRSDAALTGISEYRLIKLPVVAGERFVAFTHRYTSADFDGNGTADDVEVTLTGDTVGTETVTTPVGTFADALHTRFDSSVTIIYRPSGTRTPSSVATTDGWYARGVGPVKFVNAETPSGGATTTTTTLLTGYQVGTRTGGTLPPR